MLQIGYLRQNQEKKCSRKLSKMKTCNFQKSLKYIPIYFA